MTGAARERHQPSPRLTVRRGGSASPAEVAAIVAAVEATWPQPSADGGPGETPQRWRFSGRWWSKPLPARRDRPF